MRAFVTFVRSALKDGRRVVIAGSENERAPLVRALRRGKVELRPAEDWSAALQIHPGTAATFDADLEGGFVDEESRLALVTASDVFGDGRDQSILHPWEMELGETVKLIQDQVEQVQPRRVVFDSLSEMRLLAQDPLRYRRQVLALKQFFAGRETTVILVDDMSGSEAGREALTLADVRQWLYVFARGDIAGLGVL